MLRNGSDWGYLQVTGGPGQSPADAGKGNLGDAQVRGDVILGQALDQVAMHADEIEVTRARVLALEGTGAHFFTRHPPFPELAAQAVEDGMRFVQGVEC